ncbi:MAG: gamma-glutamyltransferase [Verrucomicrobia bacterium]|nr:gamma-glutamyltransferase [Verrucomicrobiota bacterium]
MCKSYSFSSVLLMSGLLVNTGLGQDRTQARSMVISRDGIVATEHPLASQIGAMILAQGGNAVDAAIAANAAMGVLSPMMCGIGGDLFAILHDAKSGKVYGLNASGWAPAKLTPEFLNGKGITNMPLTGIHSVTVPGAVDGWQKLLDRFGRMKFAQVLAPAIRYAEEGYPVSELVTEYWSSGEALLSKDTNASKTFLPKGRAPRLGEVFQNPALAESYQEISRHGRKAFYEGKIAQRLRSYWQRQGGTLEAGDLKDYACEWVEPISTTYRGWTVYEIPPSGQGIAALTMLNLMEQFPIGEWGPNSARALHVMIEAKKLAYADLLRYVADQRFSKVPVAGILSKDYAKERAKLIDLAKANARVEAGRPPGGGSDTTYLCVVDKEGNLVSLIQSNFHAFGSGLVADGTGFALQNRGGLFTLEPGHPNILAGRKRPLHTIIPGFMAKGEIRIAFGIMGGWNQAQAHAQFVSNVADHRMNIQAALEAPRFTKLTFGGNDVQMELRIPRQARVELGEKGHEIQLRGDFTQAVGGGQAVQRDSAAGINYGASDPRKDGAAIPEPLSGKARRTSR